MHSAETNIEDLKQASPVETENNRNTLASSFEIT